MPRSLLLLLIGSLSALGTLRADDPTPAELRARETLRNTIQQLRAAETERATLQATQAEIEQKNADLAAKLEALDNRSKAEKKALDETIADLKKKGDERDVEIGRLNESLAKWKESQQKAVALANATEAQRAKLAASVIVLERRVADQQVKNAAMFKIGNEILVRYEKFGLGDALTAREPFVGLTRVKFENLIQDYGDKLVDEKIKPTDEKPPEQKTAPSAEKTTPVQASRAKASEQKTKPQ